MSNLFYKTKPVIGLDVSRTGIRAVSIDVAKMLVHGYGSIDLDPSKIADDLGQSQGYLAEKIEELFRNNIVGKLHSNRAILGVPAARTFARTFTLPSDKESSLKDAVNLEVEQYIPMPLESLYVDSQIIKRDKKEMTVLMCAIPRKYTDTLLEITSATGIDVAMIEPSANAVARLLEYTKEGGLPTLIIDIGPAGTDIAVFDKAIRVTGGINIGGNTLTLDIAKRMNIPLETAHQFKVLSGMNSGPRQAKIVASLRPSLMRIVNETKKVMRFYTDRFPNEPRLEQVIIVGSGSNVPGLGDFFTNELIMPARIASPWQALNFGTLEPPAKQLRSRFMTAAGLSLVDPGDIWE